MMPTDYRQALLGILSRLDQLTSEADQILAEPVYADVGMMAEELRELLVDMRAKVEENLMLTKSERQNSFGMLSIVLRRMAPPQRFNHPPSLN
jgi:hypothetical protein